MIGLLVILNGDAARQLATLRDQSVQCCVTSPPYWGLRDYGTARWEGGDSHCEHEGNERYYTEKTAATCSADAFSEPGEANAARLKQGRWRNNGTCVKCGAVKIDNQLGLERTPEEYVANIVQVFREVRRVLKDDGTLWLNLGDTYAGPPCGSFNGGGFTDGAERDMDGVATSGTHNKRIKNPNSKQAKSKHSDVDNAPHRFVRLPGLKHKDLIGIPWRVAFALQADGWWLRSEITWCKRACMPESITDRPSTATEKIFLLSKSARYFYDHEAVKIEKAEATMSDTRDNGNGLRRDRLFPGQASNGGTNLGGSNGRANLKNYWLLSPEPCSEAHFAVFPSEIPRRAILAGSKPGDTILDPFGGSGTTGMVALELGRKAVLIELNPEYCKLIERRCDVTPGLALVPDNNALK